MLKSFLNFLVKNFPFFESYLPKPLKPNLAEGPNWSVNKEGKFSLFNDPVTQSFGDWTADQLAYRLERFLANLANNPKLSTCVFQSVMIDQWVAGDLLLNGDITLEQLKESKSSAGNRRIVIENFLLGSREVTLEIFRNCYYESYQFAVTGHPTGGDGVGFMAMRDIPDSVAIVTNEKVEGAIQTT
ncbi:MAG: hypothetical protein R3B41_02865 [Candidatus Doudnabacteria bacterium]